MPSTIMEQKRLSLVMGLFILVTASQCQTNTPKPEITTQREQNFSTALTNEAELPDGCCLKEDKRGIIIDLSNYPNVTNETECTNLCRHNESCVGVYWRSKTGPQGNECWLKLYANVKSVKHWSLANCADGNHSYCWKLKKNVHVSGGASHRNIITEDNCKRRCVDDLGCIGVDWDINDPAKKCWVLLSSSSISEPKAHRGRINHWIIVRIVPRTCHEMTRNIEALLEQSPESTKQSPESTKQSPESTKQSPESNKQSPEINRFPAMDTLHIALAALAGAMALAIVGISVYAVRLKNSCPAQKKVDEAKVNDFAKVYDNMVKELNDNMVKDLKANVVELEEAKEDDAESYVDYQDLRRVDDAKTYEDACEYTAMELENMKDDDNVYYNEDQ